MAISRTGVPARMLGDSGGGAEPMAEWCMAHPWMTFFLVCLALCVLDNIVLNILRVSQSKHMLDAQKKERGSDG